MSPCQMNDQEPEDQKPKSSKMVSKLIQSQRRITYLLAIAALIDCYYAFEYRNVVIRNCPSSRSTCYNRPLIVLKSLETSDSDSISEEITVVESSFADGESSLVVDNSISEEEEEISDDGETNLVDIVEEDSSFAATPFFATAVTTKNQISIKKDDQGDNKSSEMTRRQWIQAGAFLFGGATIGGAAFFQQHSTTPKKQESLIHFPQESPLKKSVSTSTKVQSPLKITSSTTTPKNSATTKSESSLPSKTQPSNPGALPKSQDIGKLEPVNLTQVVQETNVNVTMNCPEGCVSVDSKTFTKVKSAKVPNWLPAWLAPKPKVIKEISNTELLVAATIAGSTIDLMRTSLLYPIATIKTRIQTDIHNYTDTPPPISSRLSNLGSNVKRHVDEGNLYA